MHYSFTAPIHIRNNGKDKASWWFITLPTDTAQAVRNDTAKHYTRRGRGAIKVAVMLGYMKRETSIFPDKKSGSFILPVKKEIRKEFDIKESDPLHIMLELL